MSLVNPTQVISGKEIESKDVNEPINQLANVLNGNIDDANIKDGGISGEKVVLTNGSIAKNLLSADVQNQLNTLSYSFDEVDTGAKWVDGKPIYKKTINFGVLPNNTTKNIPHGITGLEWVIKYEAMAKRAQSWQGLPLVYRHTDAASNAAIEFGPVNIIIATDQDRSSFTQSLVTLYYTKS